MATVQGFRYPDHLHYDVDNQTWYEALPEGTVRTGFTPWAAKMMGEIFAFTPKRVGQTFDKARSFAVVEGGKWVAAVRAAFAGTVVSYNEQLVKRPKLLTADALGEAWMLIVRPDRDDWREGLVTGKAIATVFEAWHDAEAYKQLKS
jgi:glycine cleavage system H protein